MVYFMYLDKDNLKEKRQRLRVQSVLPSSTDQKRTDIMKLKQKLHKSIFLKSSTQTTSGSLKSDDLKKKLGIITHK